MRKIRLGKDIRISWRVRVDGGSRDLAGLDLTLELHDERRRTVRPLDFTTEGDRLFCTVRGRDQAGLGAHSLTLWLNRRKDGQSVLDASDAFCLVSRTEMEGGTDNDNLATDTVELAGDLTTAGLALPSEDCGGNNSWEELDAKLIEHAAAGTTKPHAVFGGAGAAGSALAINLPYGEQIVQYIFRAQAGKRTLFSRVVYYDKSVNKWRTRGKSDIQNLNI